MFGQDDEYSTAMLREQEMEEEAFYTVYCIACLQHRRVDEDGLCTACAPHSADDRDRLLAVLNPESL